MRKIETFGNEEELLGRIEQLKTDGIKEESLTVVSNETLKGSSFDYTNVDFKSADGTAWDKIVSFFSSEEPEARVISSLELSDQEAQKYKNELENGRILLYVNGSGSESVAKEPVADDSQDTLQQNEKTEPDTTTNLTAAGTASTAAVAGPAGVTAHDEADKTSMEDEIEADIPQERSTDTNSTRNKVQINPNLKTDLTDDQDDHRASSNGEISQVHNPSNEDATDTSKTHEYHDHSEKLETDDSHMAYGAGTDEHIAVDPSVDTSNEDDDIEKIEQHKNPDYLDDHQQKPDYGDKKKVINDDMVEDARDQHLVDTHNNPEIAEEVSPGENSDEQDNRRQPIDKGADSKDRNYSIKNDVNGEQIISLDKEER